MLVWSVIGVQTQAVQFLYDNTFKKTISKENVNILLLSLPIILVFRNNKETVEDALSLV